MFKMKGVMTNTAIVGWMLVLVFVVGLGALYVTGNLQVLQAAGGGPIITQTTQTTPITQPVLLTNCPDTKTGTLNYQYKNYLNSSNPDFLPAAVRIFSGGKQRASGTAPNTNSYQTATLSCPSSGQLYVIGDTTTNSINGVYDISGANDYQTLVGTRTSTLLFRILNSLQNNITGGDVDSFNASNAVTTSNQAIAIGDTKDYYIDVKPTTAYTQYGDHINGLLICTRASKATYDVLELRNKNNEVLQDYPVPSAVSGTDTKCWKDTGITTVEGYRTYRLHVHALIEPSTSTDLGMDFYDFQNYVALDASIKNNIRDDSNTDVGSADGYAEVSVS